MTALLAPPVVFDHPVDYRDEITARADRVRVLVVPERRYLMIDGVGAPGGVEFAAAMSSLYPVAYTLHFALKKRGLNAPVGALEGLFPTGEPHSWRLMLPVPAVAGDYDVAAAIDDVRRRKSPPTIDRLRVELWDEGLVAQILHVGAYDDEARTVDALHAAIEARGLRTRGSHHEIYISDPNRTAADRLKTVIRQPVKVL
jgi:hypothetical protein